MNKHLNMRAPITVIARRLKPWV